MQNRALIIVGGLMVLAGAAGLLYFLGAPAEAPVMAPIETTPAPRPTAAALPTTTPRLVAPRPTAPVPTVEAAPTTGTLIFESDVPDTGVFIDRVFVGTAPVTARDVKPGPHTLNFSATGFEGQVESIEVAPGTRTIAVAFKVIRLSAKIAAVHKHTIGSCSGTLTATPQGLTFETTNKGDAFTAPLTSFEAWTLDYLAKTLRLKIKNGKSYAFTDAENQVDRLFAFHKDVETARQRMLKER